MKTSEILVTNNLLYNVLLGSKDVSTLSSIYAQTARRHHLNVIKQIQITLMDIFIV